VSLRPLLLTPLLIVLLAACGGGDDGLTGQVTSLDGRLCLRTAPETARCFDATGEQLSGLALDSCVHVTYRQASGEAGKVVEIAARNPPCVSG
jgi:hypothetical protein